MERPSPNSKMRVQTRQTKNEKVAGLLYFYQRLMRYGALGYMVKAATFFANKFSWVSAEVGHGFKEFMIFIRIIHADTTVPKDAENLRPAEQAWSGKQRFQDPRQPAKQ